MFIIQSNGSFKGFYLGKVTPLETVILAEFKIKPKLFFI
jgi:hypothetical protein